MGMQIKTRWVLIIGLVCGFSLSQIISSILTKNSKEDIGSTSAKSERNADTRTRRTKGNSKNTGRKREGLQQAQRSSEASLEKFLDNYLVEKPNMLSKMNLRFFDSLPPLDPKRADLLSNEVTLSFSAIFSDRLAKEAANNFIKNNLTSTGAIDNRARIVTIVPVSENLAKLGKKYEILTNVLYPNTDVSKALEDGSGSFLNSTELVSELPKHWEHLFLEEE